VASVAVVDEAGGGEASLANKQTSDAFVCSAVLTGLPRSAGSRRYHSEKST